MRYGEGYEAAADLYRRAIQLYPTDVDAYIGLGMCLHLPGNPVSLPEAVQAYRTALQLDPQRLNALYNLGNVLIEAGNECKRGRPSCWRNGCWHVQVLARSGTSTGSKS